MADNSSMDWQRQNFKKSGSEPAQTNPNPKLTPSGTVASMHSKIATPTHGMGGLVSSGMPEPLKMANGGLIAGLAAGLGAAYLYNKNKDKEVGVDKYGFKQTGESEMRSAESDTDKARVISAGMKPKADVESSFTDNMPAKVSMDDESKPSNSGSSYTGDVGSADNNPVSKPAKSAVRKVSVSRSVTNTSPSPAPSTEPDKPVQSVVRVSKPTPIKTEDNDSRPSKPYQDVVDRAVKADKSGFDTAHGQKNFSFVEQEKKRQAAEAADKEERERKARGRKTVSEISYDPMGNAS
ncbi:MAG: hypothetical protein ACK42H_16365 [Planctomycetota bacterium]|jgi:hypothetical protein